MHGKFPPNTPLMHTRLHTGLVRSSEAAKKRRFQILANSSIHDYICLKELQTLAEPTGLDVCRRLWELEVTMEIMRRR